VTAGSVPCNVAFYSQLAVLCSLCVTAVPPAAGEVLPVRDSEQTEPCY
jgi:hypothetical protein